jgi:hypothetical protein
MTMNITNLSATRAFMLIASMTLGSFGCPVAVDEFENLDSGDEETGEVDDGYLDPTIDLGWVDNGEIPDTGEMLDAGDAGEMSDTDDTGDTCGDFAVQVDEECDGWNTNFESCLSLGFVKGQLACNDDCTFDVGGCVEVGCGNGVIDTAEMCDGSPYPCWVLGFAGSTAPDGMTPCNADCTPSESTCLAACEWGQPGCFCEETTPCTEGYICSPHPQGWANAPGTCELAVCSNVGSVCMPSMTGQMPCCPGLECVGSICM